MISREVVMYKLKAFATSLAVFTVFAVALGLLVRFVMYPDYLFWLDGGIQGLKLVWTVDFFLGPLLAFIIFHPRKVRQKLLTDMLIVGLIQFSAMTWGAYMVWSQRPVAIAYSEGQFMTLTPEVISLQGATLADLRSKSAELPSYFYQRHPASPEEEMSMIGLAFSQGIPAGQQIALFVPVSSVDSEAFSLSNRVERYVEDEMRDEWRAWALGRESATPADYRFAMFVGRYGNAVLVFDANAKLVGYLRLVGEKLPVLPLPTPRRWDAR